MVNSWSYLVVVLCLSVTSSRVLHRHGNKERLHGNDISDVRLKKFSAPPIGNGLIIDQDGYPGNSDVTHVQSSSGTPGNYHNTPDQLLPNFPQQKEGSVCDVLCRMGDGGNACMCDFLPSNISKPSLSKNPEKKWLWSKSNLPRWMYEQKAHAEKKDSSTESPICDTLCKNGEGGNACLCDWTP